MTNSVDPDQKPTDLDLHRLLRQGMSCSATEGLKTQMLRSDMSQNRKKKTYNKSCVTSKDPDQPVHSPSMPKILYYPFG